MMKSPPTYKLILYLAAAKKLYFDLGGNFFLSTSCCQSIVPKPSVKQ